MCCPGCYGVGSVLLPAALALGTGAAVYVTSPKNRKKVITAVALVALASLVAYISAPRVGWVFRELGLKWAALSQRDRTVLKVMFVISVISKLISLSYLNRDRNRPRNDWDEDQFRV